MNDAVNRNWVSGSVVELTSTDWKEKLGNLTGAHWALDDAFETGFVVAESETGKSFALPIDLPLTQATIEDISVRFAMVGVNINRLLLHPQVLSDYSKFVSEKEPIVLTRAPDDE